VRDGSMMRDRALVIDEGKIVSIAPASSIHASGAAQVVDASGKYVVPGFNDMHAHVVDKADLKPPAWPLMIANGVTGFRQMSGSPELLARGQRLRQEIKAGAVIAPEPLLLVGRLFNMAPEGGQPGITTPEAAVALVEEEKREGTEFIKVINVSRAVFYATSDQAKKDGFDLVGHLFPPVSGTDASNAGMRAFEHLGATTGNILIDCSTDEAGVRGQLMAEAAARAQQGGPPPTPQIIARGIAIPTIGLRAGDIAAIQHAIDTYSEARCRTLARLLAKNETWQVATLIRIKSMMMPDTPEFQADPNLQYVAPEQRATWREALAIYNRMPDGAKATLLQFYQADLAMMRIFRQEGVKVVAGDDLGGGLLVAGFSLHREFKELAKVGYSPLEVLQMTTIDAAQFLRRTDMGTVEAGKNADLVLLDADPTASIDNLDRIAGVVLKGRYFDAAALQKMKADTAAAYRQ
jgi:hypothetical protein